MRIVIDLQGAQSESRYRGIGRYSLAFAQAVARNRGENEVLIALSGLFPETIEPIRNAFRDLLPQDKIRVWHAPGPVKYEDERNVSRGELAEILREAFLASLSPDIIHVSSLFEGYVDDAIASLKKFDSHTPVSVSLYDLIPLQNPTAYLAPNPKYKRFYLQKLEQLKRASVLLAISESSRGEGIAELDFDKSRIINVSTAVDPKFRPLDLSDAEATELRSDLGLAKPFLLYTGGADERKNLPRLIEAYAKLPRLLRSSHQLVLAGRMPDGDVAGFRSAARRFGLGDEELIFTGYVDDDKLVALYNLCKLFVFPSWHEGFGLPALEAMACGAAVIGSRTSSLPEVIGMRDALFDPFDTESIAAKIAEVLTEPEFRKRLKSHAVVQARAFDWNDTARRSIQAWASCLGAVPESSRFVTSFNRKPKLAFVSPLPPERTGIADYSAELLPALGKHYDIELVVDQAAVALAPECQSMTVRDVEWLRENSGRFDRVLYQVGNSPFHAHMLELIEKVPGVVVLHDFFLSSLLAWFQDSGRAPNAWIEALLQSHGYSALAESLSCPSSARAKFPCSLSVFKRGLGVIVHSQHARELASKWYGDTAVASCSVVPLPRAKANCVDKLSARRRLGVEDDAFLVCSFGFLDESKLNHRLLAAWCASGLAKRPNCRLVFVGENHGGDYGKDLLETIRREKLSDSVVISGFVDSSVYSAYLSSADVGVQLRHGSRGETSAAALDCMNYGLALIVNACGSMGELPADAVTILPHEFSDAELSGALQYLERDAEARSKLGSLAKQHIQELHSPEVCAAQYASAIERFSKDSSNALTQRLLSDVASLLGAVESDFREVVYAISQNHPPINGARRIFLDVTETAKTDRRTGIERVVRAIVSEFLGLQVTGVRAEPVVLKNEGGFWFYQTCPEFASSVLGMHQVGTAPYAVEPSPLDAVLILDISGDTFISAEASGLFARYRGAGVLVKAVVYDLLPVVIPGVFPPGADEGHRKWLRAVSRLDGAICISQSVANQLHTFLSESTVSQPTSRTFAVDWWHLGADLEASAPSRGIPSSAHQVLGEIRSRPTFLMVGTVEPRKAYLETVEQFNALWEQGFDVNLVVVGHEGWRELPVELRRNIPETANVLRQHPEIGKRLFWLHGVSDEYLEEVYQSSACLVAAAYGEGFGLPLIEAAQKGLPIIARDIPVFREVAGKHAMYFGGVDSPSLSVTVARWLDAYAAGSHPCSSGMKFLTWRQSARNLLACLLGAELSSGAPSCASQRTGSHVDVGAMG